ncbi:MAG: hypothetical protein WCZ90_10435 [Melioribacteraceae bacterium]
MGAQVLLDIVGSVIIGGLLLMTLQRFNNENVANNYKYAGELVVQKNLVEIVKLIEYDFRKIGYSADYAHMPDRAKSILRADTSTIWFLTDLPTDTTSSYGNGVLDTVKYSLGATSELTSTPNPNDRKLYRQVNNSARTTANLGLTQFKLTYFDANDVKMTGMPATMPVLGYGIKEIMIDVAVENSSAYDNDYSYQNRALWRQIRLSLRNYVTR